MNFVRTIRNLFFLVASIYVVQHIYNECPLSEPLDQKFTINLKFNGGKFDPICYSSHQIYHYSQPTIQYITTVYESSPIKSYVDKSVQLIDPYIIQTSEYLNHLREEIAAYREEHEQYVLNESYKTMSKLIATVTNFLKDTIYPVISDSVKTTFRFTKYYSRKLQIQAYLHYNIYVKPLLYTLIHKFMASPIGEYYIKAVDSAQFKLFAKYVKLICSYIIKGFNYVVENVKYAYKISKAFKDTDSYKIVELKQNFLRDYARYLPNNFKFDVTKTDESVSITLTTSVISSKPTPVVPTSEKFDFLLQNTIKSANDDFNNQVDELTDKFKIKLHNEFQPELKTLSQNVNSNYDNIHRLLDKINVIKDSSDELYVSRELFRNQLSLKRDEIESHVDKINSRIENFANSYIDEILKVRIGILDTLEEFADSSLNAYSSQIISNGDDWNEWKKYKEIKNKLVEFRDDLVSRKPNVDLSNSLNSLKGEVHLLLNEAGSYLSILRAKANIEFQMREKEEKEEKEAMESLRIQQENDEFEKVEYYDDDLETETITQTVYETISTNIKSASSLPSDIVVEFVTDESDEVKVVIENAESDPVEPVEPVEIKVEA